MPDAEGPVHTPIADVTEKFPEAAAAVIKRVRDAIRGILADTPGQPSKAQAIADAFDIDLTLAWKLTNVVQTPDPFAAAQSLPGASGVEIFVRAAQRRGISETRASELREALRGFEGLIEVHAGDRASMDSMLGHLARRGTERSDLLSRRSAFKANAAILGVRCRAQTVTYVCSPSGAGAGSVALISGLIELDRLRPEMAWLVGRSRYLDNARPGQDPGRIALDPTEAARHDGVPMLPVGRRGTLPRFRRSRWPDGVYADHLLPGAVGKTASVTFYRGESMPWTPVFDEPGGTSVLRLALSCHTPCELGVLDVLLHRAYEPVGEASVLLASELGGVSIQSTPEDELVKLPLLAEAESLDAGLDSLELPEDTGYGNVLRWSFDRLGVRPEDMRAMRLRVKYPPIPCSAILEWRLRPA